MFAMNTPNILTLSRIGFSFLLLLILAFADVFGSALPYVTILVFGIGMLTDFLDGYLARKHNIITIFGEVFDPLADKMLVLAAFIGLLYLQRADPIAVFLIFSREFLVTGLRVMASSGGESVAASKLGKIKTVLQTVAIFFLLGSIPGGDLLLWLATAVTLYSGYEYFNTYFLKREK